MNSFIQALEAEGIIVKGALINDGKIHRLPTSSHPRSKNGWYVLYEDEISGNFGNWENGSVIFWKDNNSSWTAVDQARAELRRKTLKEELEKEKDVAAQIAWEFIDGCKTQGFSNYLRHKKIGANGAVFNGSDLIVPIYDNVGQLWSYQKISSDGSKLFHTGGRVQGCYFTIATKAIKDNDRVVVCEGFATGASIHEATGLPVIVAFNAGNLKAVCENLPYSNILIAADNDKPKDGQELGIGELKAIETGYSYVMPVIVGNDFSDEFIAGSNLKKFFALRSEEIVSTGGLVAHGLVGEIAAWITATAIKPQPLLALGAALTLVGLLKGHKFKTGTGLRTNLLTLSVAPTASGKEHPQQCIYKLLEAAGLEKMILDEPGSGAGLHRDLTDRNAKGILVLDEIGRWLANVAGKNSGGWQKEIIDMIMKSFSTANSVLKGKALADAKNSWGTIKNPLLCVFGSTVKERLVEACGSGHKNDGFLNRWIIFENEIRPDEVEDLEYIQEVPMELVEKVKLFTPKSGSYGAVEEAVWVHYTPEARDIMKAYSKANQIKLNSVKPPFDDLYARNKEHVAKIALIMCDNENIRPQDLEFAIKLVDQSANTMAKFANLIVDSEGEAHYNKILEIVKSHKIISRNELTRKTHFLKGGKRQREELIQSMLDNNEIAELREGKKTSYKFI